MSRSVLTLQCLPELPSPLQPVRIGGELRSMEQTVLRGAGRYACTLDSHILVGPHASISGAVIHDACFLATGAVIFNQTILETGTWIAVRGVVHIGTRCPPGTYVPIGHIAVGNPAQVYPPHEALAASAAIATVGFTQTVFGFEADTLAEPETIRAICDRYTGALQRHRHDRIVDPS